MTHTPDLRDRLPQGAGTYVVNSFIDPALPNIKGGPILNWAYHFASWGAIEIYDVANNWADYTFDTIQGYRLYSSELNASRCSSIYRDDCNTVQPPALAVNFYIKAR